MALADEIIQWSNAVELFENGMIEESVKKFCNIKLNSKIAFNIGYCYWSLLNIANSHQKFREAIQMDKKLAVAYAMLGQISFYEKRYWEAFCEYEFAFQNLRGNRYVDYKPLGLDYQLYASEVLVNMGIISYFLQRDGELYFTKSVKFALETRLPEFNKIQSESQAFRCEKFFTITGMKLFQPSHSSVENAQKKNFLGNAKIISVRDEFPKSFAALKQSTEQPDETTQLPNVDHHRQPPKRPKPPKLTVGNFNSERTTFHETKKSCPSAGSKKPNRSPNIDEKKHHPSPIIPKRPAVSLKTGHQCKPNVVNVACDTNSSIKSQRPTKPQIIKPKPASFNENGIVNTSKIYLEKSPYNIQRLTKDRPSSHSFPSRRFSETDEWKNRAYFTGRSVPRPPMPRKPLPIFPPPDQKP